MQLDLTTDQENTMTSLIMLNRQSIDLSFAEMSTLLFGIDLLKESLSEKALKALNELDIEGKDKEKAFDLAAFTKASLEICDELHNRFKGKCKEIMATVNKECGLTEKDILKGINNTQLLSDKIFPRKPKAGS